jgi:hypothetical protein
MKATSNNLLQHLIHPIDMDGYLSTHLINLSVMREFYLSILSFMDLSG